MQRKKVMPKSGKGSVVVGGSDVCKVGPSPRKLTFVNLWVSENRLFWVER